MKATKRAPGSSLVFWTPTRGDVAACGGRIRGRPSPATSFQSCSADPESESQLACKWKDTSRILMTPLTY
jgi:alpha-tubulin suppressor-like RCC1 family protein